MGEEVVIRTARPKDTRGVLAQMKSVLAEEGHHLLMTLEEFTMTEEKEKELLEQYEKSSDLLFLVAQCGGQIVGSLIGKRGERKRMSHLIRIAMSLKREFRARGIGFHFWRHSFVGRRNIPTS
jgi:hypothetical protein